MTIPVLPTPIDAAELEVASRCLAHWRAEDLTTALVNGQPGTFSRGAFGTTFDVNGTLRAAGDQQPRWQPRAWSGGTARTDMGLLLESGRTNLCTRSQEFDTWTAQNGCTVTANALTAPDGSLTADLINSPSGTGAAGISKAVTFTGDGEKCVSVYVKQGTSTVIDIGLFNATGGGFLHFVRATWTAGVPVLTTLTGSGTRHAVEHAGNGWYRVAFSAASVVAANSSLLYLYPTNSSGAIGTTYAWGAQVEDAAAPSSYIITGAAAAYRNPDLLSWAADWRPQPFAFWCEFIFGWRTPEQGTLFSLSGVGSSTYCIAYFSGTTLTFEMVNNGVGSGTALSAPTALGDRVIARGQVFGDGSVQLWLSVNGGTEQASGRSGANANGLPAAWGTGTRLRLNHYMDNSIPSGNWYKRLKIVPGIPDRTTLSRVL